MCDDNSFCKHLPYKPIFSLKKLATSDDGDNRTPINPVFKEKFTVTETYPWSLLPYIYIENMDDIPVFYEDDEETEEEFKVSLKLLLQHTINNARVFDRVYEDTLYLAFGQRCPNFKPFVSHTRREGCHFYPSLIKVSYAIKDFCSTRPEEVTTIRVVIRGIRMLSEFDFYQKRRAATYGRAISRTDRECADDIKKINLLPFICLCHKESNRTTGEEEEEKNVTTCC